MDEKPSTSHQNEIPQKDQSSSREKASLQMSSQLTLLKHALNSDKVQLWNPPYTLENGKRGEINQEMLLKYASIVKTSTENILEMMEILRMNAVKKLAARGKFQEKGIATLKLRICANCESLVSRPESVEQTGCELKKQVVELCGVSDDRIKLIVSGQLVQDENNLMSQKVKIYGEIKMANQNITASSKQNKQGEVTLIYVTNVQITIGTWQVEFWAEC